ncbi:MAG TPA: hypothetical protein VGN52_09855 [Burkholderiales bacterium]
MMTHEMNKLGFSAEGRRVGENARSPVGFSLNRRAGFPLMRPLVVSASSLAIAGLLGACATHPAMTASSGSVGAPGTEGNSATRVLANLKDAEAAVTDYARSVHHESELRKSVETASNAALVARHRASISTTDLLATANAETRLAAARRELRMGEATTRAARGRLYRALGLEDNTALTGSSGGAAGDLVKLPLPGDRAPRFAPDAAL